MKTIPIEEVTPGHYWATWLDSQTQTYSTPVVLEVEGGPHFWIGAIGRDCVGGLYDEDENPYIFLERIEPPTITLKKGERL